MKSKGNIIDMYICIYSYTLNMVYQHIRLDTKLCFCPKTDSSTIVFIYTCFLRLEAKYKCNQRSSNFMKKKRI